MKNLVLAATMLLVGIAAMAQTRNLPKPNMQRKTLSVMETYKQRKSVREYSNKPLSDQDLSDLLWAAQGKNRADGHLTADRQNKGPEAGTPASGPQCGSWIIIARDG